MDTERYSEWDQRPFETTSFTDTIRREDEKRRTARGIDLIADKIEATFGPNPCQRLTLRNTETGETINRPCDGKRCPDCGKRKEATMRQQLATYGDIAYIGRSTSKANINKALEAAKKRKQRNGIDFTYQIVGDDYHGWLIVSDEQILPAQRRMRISDWWDRIVTAYKYGQRMRRSRRLGRMSLVTLRRKGQVGTTPWSYLSGAPDLVGHAMEWADELTRITKKRQEEEEEWELQRMINHGPSLRTFSDGLPSPM